MSPQLDQLGLAGAFGAGVLSFLSPCLLPLLPVYLAYVSGLALRDEDQATGRAARLHGAGRIVAFAAGLTLVFAALGASASVLGGWLADYRFAMVRIGGLAVLIFGLHLLGLLRIPALNREYRPALAQPGRPGVGGVLGAATMGAAFGLGWTPCVGPMLGTILILASQSGSDGEGTLLLLAYALGLGVPFVLTGLAVNRTMGLVMKARRLAGTVERLSGALIVAMGLLLVTDSLSAAGRWLDRLF